jgi:hypothetical protein
MLQIVRIAGSVKYQQRRRVWPPPNLKEPEESKRRAPKQWRRASAWSPMQSS